MWSNFSNVVGAAIQQVQKIQSEIETQMDQAVGANPNNGGSPTLPETAAQSKESNNIIIQPSEQKPRVDSTAGSLEEISLQETKHPVKDEKSRELGDEMDVNKLNEKIADLSEENEILLERTVKLEEKIRSFEKIRRDLEQKNDHLSRQLDQMKIDNDSLKQKLVLQEEEMEKERVQYKLSLESAASSINTEPQQTVFETVWREEKDTYEKKFEQMILELRQLTELLNEEKDKRSFLSEEWEIERQRQKEKIENLESQLQSKSMRQSIISSSEENPHPAELKYQALQAEIESERKQYETRINLLQKEINRIEESKGENSAPMEEKVHDLEARLESERKEFEEKIRSLNTEITRLETNLETQRVEFEKQSSTWLNEKKAFQDQYAQLQQENHQLQLVIKERERALETSTLKASELHKQTEELQRTIHDVKSELQEKDHVIRQSQSLQLQESEVKREILRLSELLKEKETKLAAFEEEGSKLAKKQSEMEKLVRKSRQEVKEKETEITRLKESRDQLVKAVEQTQDALKKQEAENLNLTKTLNAMNAVSQASSDKLTKLENELQVKQEELVGQRKALEGAWSELNEMKRSVTELKAERDDLRRQIGEGTTKVMESEGFRREIEQREAILKATSMQLQENLRHQMSESILREERLREEINDLRKKWQEAITSREALSSELTSATAPLLRQISSLQETLRVRSEQWQVVESQLTERLFRAENINETFDQKRLLLEEQVASLKSHIGSLQQKLQESQGQLYSLQGELEKAQRQESLYREERDEFEKRWNEEHLSRQNTMNTLREVELKHKIDRQDLIDQYQTELLQRDQEIKRLSQEVTSLQQQSVLEESSLSSANNNRSRHSPFMTVNHDSSNHLNYSSNGKNPLGNHGSSGGMSEVKLSNSFQDELSNLNLANGERSFVANEKLSIRQQQREEEMKMLQAQINQLQISRNALLEEVSYLSARNAQLEDDLVQFPSLKAEVADQKKQLEVLLVLLGEKEEELEAAYNDMKEVKDMYRDHLEDLLQKMLPPDVVAASPSREKFSDEIDLKRNHVSD